MKICVIIPSFNEEKAISKLIREVIREGFEPIVIDDGSKDDTVHLAKAAGAIVLSQPQNQGKGAVLKIGFKYALKNSYDAIFTIDADGQHDPKELKNFLVEATRKGSAIVVGNRMSSYKNMPLIRILTNKFMSLIISLMCQQDIPDTQCGYRFVTVEVLKNIDLFTSNYEIESEMLVKAAHKGFKIDSYPIESIYTGQKSQINPFVDTFRFFKFLIEYFFKRKNA